MSEAVDHVPEVDALPEGAPVSGYVIRRVLGHGGFGITYEAQHRVTRRHFAIKEFFPSSMARRDGQSRLTYAKTHAETIEWALRKFEETTTTLCDLSHPNIVEVHDYVPANNTGYMVMELLRGLTLKQWLEARGTPPRLDELRPLVDPVIAALVYVHGRGLIHRDIAPDNILITEQGRPVLIDFGSVSRDLGDARHQSFSGTTGLTKRHYTAPEQMRAKAKPTPESDIYSMGAVLYRALTGADPMDGFDRVLAGVDPLEPLASGRAAACPPGVAQAIDKALALRPDARFKTMAELGDSLAEHSSSRSAPSLRDIPEPGGVRPVVEMAAQTQPRDETSAAAQRHVVRGRVRRWVLGGGRLAESAPRLERSRKRWRALTLAFGAIAAAIVVFIVVERASLVAPEPAGSYLAAINRGGEKPAMLVRVDIGTRKVTILPGATEAPAGHTLELWYIGDDKRPRAVGVVDKHASTLVFPGDARPGAILVVSVEPPGGSKTAGPTGPIVASGQLVKIG